MASTKKVRRRLKKNVLITLLLVTVVMMCVFAGLIKNVSAKGMKEEHSNSEKFPMSVNAVKEVNPKTEEVDKSVIIIDPAFGGEYAGSKGFDGVLQKDVNLDIALKIKNSLERYDDVEVFLTREKDDTVSYEQRLSLIKGKKANIVVSIQQNTEGSGKAEGVETYILKKSDYPEYDSSLGYSIQKAMGMYSTSTSRGVMTRNINILKDSYEAGAIGAVVYTGFITNEKESKKLTTDKYTEKLAEGIAQGILSYVDKVKESK